jgi:tetratricopeptide (TPR) repeat protein
MAELKRQCRPLDDMANATGQARLLYAQAELAKLLRNDAAAQSLCGAIARRFKTEELSPVLLALVGDYLLAKGDARAEKYYSDLREDYPKSDYLDFAYVGLGELAMAGKDYQQALELFSHAADEIPGLKVKEATIGKARALFELGEYTDARKLFQQVAGVREWHGESTALALYYLGEIEARQGHWADAIAQYQRVFVAYQKFIPWAAKAYLGSAQSFEKLGRRAEAIGHLKEMLRSEKLKDSPEAKQAAKMLVDWGAV